MKKGTIKFLVIFGYTVSIIVSLIGIAILAGLLLPENIPDNFRYLMGIVFILYGIYRAVTIWTKQRKFERNEE